MAMASVASAASMSSADSVLPSPDPRFWPYEDEEENATLLSTPHNGTVMIENTTYCWDEALRSYTWCQDDASQLYAVPLSVILLLSLCYGLISVVAIGGNLLVIVVVTFTRSMHNVTNFYIANLASADVIIAVFCIPFQFYAALLQRWDLPEFMCQFCPFAQTLSLNVSIFTLVTISLDRYKAIMNPLRDRSSRFSAKLIIAVIWLSAVVLALPMVFFFEVLHVFDDLNGGLKPFCTLSSSLLTDLTDSPEETTADDNDTANSSYSSSHGGNGSRLWAFSSLSAAESVSEGDLALAEDAFEDGGEVWGERFLQMTSFQSYNVALSLVQYVVPLIIITYAYVRMGIKLWLTKTPGAAQHKRDLMILVNKKKTIKMLFTVVTIFGICWLPWHVYQTATIVVPEIIQYRYINIIFFVSHWLAMSNSCYNPFIYAIYSEKFKREFRECAHCKRCRSLLYGESEGHAGIEEAATAGHGQHGPHLHHRQSCWSMTAVQAPDSIRKARCDRLAAIKRDSDARRRDIECAVVAVQVEEEEEEEEEAPLGPELCANLERPRSGLLCCARSGEEENEVNVEMRSKTGGGKHGL